MVFLQLAQELPAVAPGHDEIEQDQIRGLYGDRRECLVAVRGLADGVAVLLKGEAQELARALRRRR